MDYIFLLSCIGPISSAWHLSPMDYTNTLFAYGLSANYVYLLVACSLWLISMLLSFNWFVHDTFKPLALNDAHRWQGNTSCLTSYEWDLHGDASSMIINTLGFKFDTAFYLCISLVCYSSHLCSLKLMWLRCLHLISILEIRNQRYLFDEKYMYCKRMITTLDDKKKKKWGRPPLLYLSPYKLLRFVYILPM